MSSSDASDPAVCPKRAPAVAWAALFVFGFAGWTLYATLSDRGEAARALLVNFIFFTPLAAGMVMWPAIVALSRGGWLGSVKQDALAGIVIAPLSLAAFAALAFLRGHWAGWLNAVDLPSKEWFGDTALFVRDGAALTLWWAMALRFAIKSRRGECPKVLAGWLGLVYAITFSLIAFDLVMGLDPRWVSSLFGAYFFVTGLYAAVAALAFVASLKRKSEPDCLHDLGKLVLAFSVGSAYMMFSQLLPIWYENLPHEVAFVIPRMSFYPWAWASAALLAIVYLGPLALLLSARAKRTPWRLGTVSFLILTGLWVERWWLVAPTLGQEPRLSPPYVLACLGFVGALGWGINLFNRNRPRVGVAADK